MSEVTGSAKLAATLQQRMKALYSYGAGVTLEFGRITASGGLKLDDFPHTIPKGSYYICKSLLMDKVTTGSKENHTHSVPVGEANKLSSGCRVLVGWVGNEPVVIDQIES